MRKFVIYAGSFDFPNNNAAAIRVLGNGYMLRSLGFDVIYLGKNKVCRYEDLSPDGTYRFHGFKYIARPQKRSKLSYYTDIDFITQEVERIGVEAVHAIITYHLPSTAMLRLGRFCKRNAIIQVADVTEWYSIKRQLGKRYFSFQTIDFLLRMHYVQRKIGKVLAISSLLRDYYRKAGQQTVRIPTVSIRKKSIDDLNRVDSRDIIQFCYSGSPTQKDLIADIVVACQTLMEEGLEFKMNIVGLSENQFVKLYKQRFGVIHRNIIFFGRVPHNVSIDIVSHSDYTVLLRANERYANAGFPTKFTESLANGVPVIANVTSDIGQYLFDGVNGFVVPQCTVDSLRKTMKKAILQDRGQLYRMKVASLRIANDMLHYSHFTKKMEGLLIENG